ncbi:MAG: hypothetical protein KDB22_28365, partial [Planctomycetales bacterium]|nr:hypothetical protein [Planctomycetales bacterium]
GIRQNSRTHRPAALHIGWASTCAHEIWVSSLLECQPLETDSTPHIAPQGQEERRSIRSNAPSK